MAKEKEMQRAVEFQGKTISAEELYEQLNGMNEGMEMTANYYEFQEGEVERFVVVGYSEMASLKDPKETVIGIKMIVTRKDAKGNISMETVLNASSVISQSLGIKAKQVQNGEIKPFPVQISYLGKVMGKGGHKYDNFRIHPLAN